jgi:hypothetical protein
VEKLKQPSALEVSVIKPNDGARMVDIPLSPDTKVTVARPERSAARVYNAAGNSPSSFSLTFTKPGRYVYWCLVHDEAHQEGIIIAKSAKEWRMFRCQKSL